MAVNNLTFISIHASLAGGDGKSDAERLRWRNFNPRLPRGRRHELNLDWIVETIFQSTPPSREATKACKGIYFDGAISIHASLAGGDPFQT